jgi:CDP-paratose 2-epimerase
MKNTVVITGSLGLVGMESVLFFLKKKYNVVGIDNDMRNYFFGSSVLKNKKKLIDNYNNYTHLSIDIRNKKKISDLFLTYKKKIALIIHCAAQPSHDWATLEPHTDFEINANGTLNLLTSFLKYSPDATFIFMSTNKVYGDRSNNELTFVEKKMRYELKSSHQYYKNGIPENFSIDQSKHSLFGVSKASADLMVQEFGRYYNLKTAVFRGGCLTGPLHEGAELHGFLSYLLKCNLSEKTYFIKGYKGKQVRDNIHSYDLVNAFWHFFLNPRYAEVYNIGGGRFSNCSILEANKIIEDISKKKTKFNIKKEHRVGDHIWWISDTRKFQSHYKDWRYKYNIFNIIEDMFKKNFIKKI